MTSPTDWQTGAFGFPRLPLPEAPHHETDPDTGVVHQVFESFLPWSDDLYADGNDDRLRVDLTAWMTQRHLTHESPALASLLRSRHGYVLDLRMPVNAHWWRTAEAADLERSRREGERLTRAIWLIWHLTGLLGTTQGAVERALSVLSDDGTWVDAIVAGWAQHERP